MSEKKAGQIRKADLVVGARFYRNGQRNNVYTIRSVDTRSIARNRFEVEFYQDYGAGQKVFWYTLAEVKQKYTLL